MSRPLLKYKIEAFLPMQNIKLKKKIKVIPVRGRGELYSCVMLSIPYYLEIGSQMAVMSVSRTAHSLLLRNIVISGPVTRFCMKLSRPQGLVWPERSDK
jgi:hypothetical protein